MRRFGPGKGVKELGPADIQRIRQTLADKLAALPVVVVVYLFGSYGRLLKGGRGPSPLSDIDIAVLLESTQEQEKLYTELFNIFTTAFGRDDIDLVVLNEAPPLLCSRVLRDGYCLYVRDELARIRWEVAARREYLDTAPLRAIQAQYLHKRIKEGDFGGRQGDGGAAPAQVRRIREFLARITKGQPR